MARKDKTYIVETGNNGKKYVNKNSVGNVLHVVDGNSKTGEECGNYNLPIEYTCRHDCNCYKKCDCYACGGFYQFMDNQAGYSENLNYYLTTEQITFIETMVQAIEKKGYSIFRYFTCGDIPDYSFITSIVEIAKRCKNVKFWLYTKKYNLVNKWIDENGLNSIPDNLTIIFSHWLNNDGTHFPMDNKYTFPTSEFIPYGKEELVKTVTHVCPCSDPTVKATCATCKTPCYELKHGESMALLEHSTSRTKQRDKAIKAAKAQLQ